MHSEAKEKDSRETSNTPRAAFNEKEAAYYLGVSVQLLRQSRCYGNLPNRTPGPPYVKIGRAVRYLVKDLDDWLEERRVTL